MSLTDPTSGRPCVNGCERDACDGMTMCGDCLTARARKCPDDCLGCAIMAADIMAADDMPAPPATFESLGPVLGDD